MLPELVKRMDSLMHDLNLPLAGRKYIRDTYTNGPSRQVQNRRSVLMVLHSAKTGLMNSLESRTGEYPAAVMLEKDPDVLGYFVQAKEIQLSLCDEGGVQRSRVMYRPDFLIVRKNRFVVREQKDETELANRMFRNPYQFYKDEHNQWHYRAAEEAFAALGIDFEVVSNSSLPEVLMLNSNFLADYHLESAPPVPEDVLLNLKAALQKHKGLAMRHLLEVEYFSADHIFKAVADGHIIADQEHDRLFATDELMLFCDEQACRAQRLLNICSFEQPLPIPGLTFLAAGHKLTIGKESYTVELTGEREAVLIKDETKERVVRSIQWLKTLNEANLIEGMANEEPQTVKQLAHMSNKELERANNRLAAINGENEGQFAARTLRKYQGLVSCVSGPVEALISLGDNYRKCGNRTARFPGVVGELADKAIEARYNTPVKPPKKSAYASYQLSCMAWSEANDSAITPMSYPSFCKRCDELESVLKRQGKRVAYQLSAIEQAIQTAYPVHGVMPHEVCYIDHTTLNLSTRTPEGVKLGKPWLTVAVDGNCLKTRAFVVTYDAPWYGTVMLVLRDYVKRHGRLPKILSLDNGKEFRSNALKEFCKLFGITLRFRSPGQPRGGAVVERLLGATEQEVIANLEGNTIAMKDPRLVTKSVNGFYHGVWTIVGLHAALEEYLFKIRHERVHPTLGQTPNEYEAQRLKETGERTHTMVAFNENFMLLTSPRTKNKTHSICSRRGVYANGRYYNHRDFKLLKDKARVEVRIEMWRDNVVYVHVKDHWVAAIGSTPRVYDNRPHKEVAIARRAAEAQARKQAQVDGKTLKQAKFTESLIHPNFFDQRIRAEQVEARLLFTRLGLAQLPVQVDLPPEREHELREHATSESQADAYSTPERNLADEKREDKPNEGQSTAETEATAAKETKTEAMQLAALAAAYVPKTHQSEELADEAGYH